MGELAADSGFSINFVKRSLQHSAAYTGSTRENPVGTTWSRGASRAVEIEGAPVHVVVPRSPLLPPLISWLGTGVAVQRCPATSRPTIPPKGLVKEGGEGPPLPYFGRVPCPFCSQEALPRVEWSNKISKSVPTYTFSTFTPKSTRIPSKDVQGTSLYPNQAPM